MCVSVCPHVISISSCRKKADSSRIKQSTTMLALTFVWHVLLLVPLIALHSSSKNNLLSKGQMQVATSDCLRKFTVIQGSSAGVCVIVYLWVLLLYVSSNDPQANLSHPFKLCSTGCCRSSVPSLQPVEQIHHSFKDLKTHTHACTHTCITMSTSAELRRNTTH